MINPLFRVGILCFLWSISFTLDAQENDKSILVTVETLERDYKQPEETEKKASATIKNPKDYFRHHKKLSKTFEGYLIELTTSDFPLKRDYHLFEQFGEVYYEQVKGKGYAYLIMADFSSKKAIEQYVENVIRHKAPEARVVTYKKGERTTK